MKTFSKVLYIMVYLTDNVFSECIKLDIFILLVTMKYQFKNIKIGCDTQNLSTQHNYMWYVAEHAYRFWHALQ